MQLAARVNAVAILLLIVTGALAWLLSLAVNLLPPGRETVRNGTLVENTRFGRVGTSYEE